MTTNTQNFTRAMERANARIRTLSTELHAADVRIEELERTMCTVDAYVMSLRGELQACRAERDAAVAA